MIIKADSTHVNWIIRHRVEMFRSMGWQTENLNRTSQVTQTFLEQHWNMENPAVFLKEVDSSIVGGCAVSFYQVLPDNRNTSGYCAYVLNMYVEPEYRGKGYATELIHYIIEYCKTKNIGKISLHDTMMSKNIYEKAGFVLSTNHYQLYL